MALAVVDALEMVQVQNRQHQRSPGALAALQLHADEFGHVPAVHQPGELVVRGQVADTLQRLRELVLLLRQPAPDVPQPDGNKGAAHQHQHDHGAMRRFQRGRAPRLIEHGHRGQRRREHQQGVRHVGGQLPRRHAEDAEHQHQRQDHRRDPARLPQEHVGGGVAQQRVADLPLRHRGILQAERPAAADQHQHGNQPTRGAQRPPPGPVLAAKARVHQHQHHHDAQRHHQHRKRGHPHADAHGRLGAQ